jgi:predicted ABC-type ATPase
MKTDTPRVVVLAGINGAGKTTSSQEILVNMMRIPTFVNADAIARGLNGFNPESVALSAGRIMLDELRNLAARRQNFAFETTLAGKTYASWLESIRATGYEVYLFYYWLDSPETAIGRVAARVKAGGHHVPDDTIRQRYSRSVRNLFELHRPIADEWRVYDNTHGQRRLIALGTGNQRYVIDGDTWFDVLRSGGHDADQD